jgi:hypothetical protein
MFVMARGLKSTVMVAIGGLIALLLVLFLVGTAIGYGSISMGAGVPLLVGGVALLLMVGAFWVGVLWMRSIDEAAREAHKWAWYWGGTAGMAVGGALMLLTIVPRDVPLRVPLILGDTPDPAGYAASGAFGLMMLMTLGYSVAWAVWWLRHR